MQRAQTDHAVTEFIFLSHQVQPSFHCDRSHAPLPTAASQPRNSRLSVKQAYYADFETAQRALAGHGAASANVLPTQQAFDPHRDRHRGRMSRPMLDMEKRVNGAGMSWGVKASFATTSSLRLGAGLGLRIQLEVLLEQTTEFFVNGPLEFARMPEVGLTSVPVTPVGR